VACVANPPPNIEPSEPVSTFTPDGALGPESVKVRPRPDIMAMAAEFDVDENGVNPTVDGRGLLGAT